MPQVIRCPSCQKAMQAPDNAAGRNVRCPACNSPFTVPNWKTASTTATTATAVPVSHAVANRLMVGAKKNIAPTPTPPPSLADQPEVTKIAVGPLLGVIAGGLGLLLVLGLTIFWLMSWDTTKPVQVAVEDEQTEKVAPKNPKAVQTKVVIEDEKEEAAPAPPPPLPIHPMPLVRYARGGAEYGIVALRNRSNQPLNKQITYGQDGNTNRTLIRFDNEEFTPARFAGQTTDKTFPNAKDGQSVSRTERVYKRGQIVLRHILEIVPSKQPALIGGKNLRLLDTVLCRYVIENNDTQSHTFGMRTQVDTLIGGNDGVPFTVPGQSGLVSTFADFRGGNQPIPPFIQALEFPNLNNPGTVALMTIKVGGKVEPPARLSLTCWRADRGPYEVPLTAMAGDSCVVLYWPEKELPANQRREIGYAYGLGAVEASEGAGKLGITLAGSYEPGQVFTVTAYLTNPMPNQTATLEVPAGLAVRETATRKVEPPDGGQKTSVVTWNVKVEKAGEFRVSVSSGGNKQSKLITITQQAQGGGEFGLELAGDIAPGKDFKIIARVTNPVPDQKLTLLLPAQLKLVDGAVTQKVPSTKGVQRLVWTVRVVERGTIPLWVESTTGIKKGKTIKITAEAGAGNIFGK